MKCATFRHQGRYGVGVLTPAGVGIGFDPPRYLQPGDRLRIEIPPIGVLENPLESLHPV